MLPVPYIETSDYPKLSSRALADVEVDPAFTESYLTADPDDKRKVLVAIEPVFRSLELLGRLRDVEQMVAARAGIATFDPLDQPRGEQTLHGSEMSHHGCDLLRRDILRIRKNDFLFVHFSYSPISPFFFGGHVFRDLVSNTRMWSFRISRGGALHKFCVADSVPEHYRKTLESRLHTFRQKA